VENLGSKNGALTSCDPAGNRATRARGFESVYLVSLDYAGGATSFRGAFTGGLNFDVFLEKNVHLGINASFFIRRATLQQVASTDLGGIFTAVVGYSGSMGGGLFVRPFIGGGGFIGSRSSSAGTEGLVYGGAVRGGLSLVFYASRNFKVHAGPEAILNIGAHAPNAGGDTIFLISMDSGFNVGITYVF